MTKAKLVLLKKKTADTNVLSIIIVKVNATLHKAIN